MGEVTSVDGWTIDQQGAGGAGYEGLAGIVVNGVPIGAAAAARARARLARLRAKERRDQQEVPALMTTDAPPGLPEWVQGLLDDAPPAAAPPVRRGRGGP